MNQRGLFPPWLVGHKGFPEGHTCELRAQHSGGWPEPSPRAVRSCSQPHPGLTLDVPWAPWADACWACWTGCLTGPALEKLFWWSGHSASCSQAVHLYQAWGQELFSKDTCFQKIHRSPLQKTSPLLIQRPRARGHDSPTGASHKPPGCPLPPVTSLQSQKLLGGRAAHTSACTHYRALSKFPLKECSFRVI